MLHAELTRAWEAENAMV
jgi:hypothetical protein